MRRLTVFAIAVAVIGAVLVTASIMLNLSSQHSLDILIRQQVDPSAAIRAQRVSDARSQRADEAVKEQWKKEYPEAYKRMFLEEDPSIESCPQDVVEISSPSPQYPAAARYQGISGQVTLQVFIDETGKVKRAIIVNSSNPLFVEPSILAVSGWRYKVRRAAFKSASYCRKTVVINYKLKE